MNFKVRDMTMIAVSVALIAIGAFIKIPSPVAGYFTLQLPFVIMISMILGAKRGAMAAFVYMIGGLMGIPWFAAGGGFMYIVKPTFGFIMSFVMAAYIAGMGSDRYKRNEKGLYIYSIMASIIVWVYGMLHYTFVLQVTTGTELTYYAALIGILSPDFYTDIVLTIIFTGLGQRIRKGVASL